MRNVVVSEFITLDGIFEDPGGAEGTLNGGWSMKYTNEDYQKYKYDELVRADTILLGYNTYKEFAAAWPKMEGTGDFGKRMNEYPKYVLSIGHDDLNWQNTHVLGSDAATEIMNLKKQDGKDILVFGSGQVVRFLIANRLVDRICLMVHPVILGSGKQLFAGSEKQELKLEKTISFHTGAVVLEYAITFSSEEE